MLSTAGCLEPDWSCRGRHALYHTGAYTELSTDLERCDRLRDELRQAGKDREVWKRLVRQESCKLRSYLITVTRSPRP
jgi:hypothetical protein